MENESEVKITFTGEHGEFSIRKFINREKPECVICEKTDCDEYLFFFCHCWGCDDEDYVCKNCALTTQLFTHLCRCFRQNSHHMWYDLKVVFGKIEGINRRYNFLLFISSKMSYHHCTITFKFLDNKKKCSICNLQSPIYYDNIYYVVECGCGLCGAVSYTCDECVETHKIQKCTENKICWLCKTVKCKFF